MNTSMNRFLATACAVAITAILIARSPAQEAASDPQAVKELTRLVEVRAVQDGTIRTFRVKYEFDWMLDVSSAPPSSLPEGLRDKPQQSNHRVVEYIRDGAKYYHTIHFDEIGPYVFGDYTVAHDGQTYMVRPGNVPQLRVSKKSDAFKMGTQLPERIVEPLTPAELLEQVKKGGMTLVGTERVQQDGKSILRFNVRVGPQHGQLDYDPESSYMMVASKIFDTQNALVTETRSTKIGAFDVDGNTVHYPLEGFLRAYSDGKIVQSNAFKVVPDQIQFNSTFEPKIFVIHPKENESVYDADTGMAVVDAGKKIDLRKDIENRGVSGPTKPNQQARTPKPAEDPASTAIPKSSLPPPPAPLPSNSPPSPSWYGSTRSIVFIAAGLLAVAGVIIVLIGMKRKV